MLLLKIVVKTISYNKRKLNEGIIKYFTKLALIEGDIMKLYIYNFHSKIPVTPNAK